MSSRADEIRHEKDASLEVEDVRDLLVRMPASPYDTFEGTYVLSPELFPVKHARLKALDAISPVRSIVETGAYFGAFLLTALDACPELLWLRWIDDESYTAGSNALCERNLSWYSEVENARRPTLWQSGSRQTDLIAWIDDVQPDLVHVDGDHSFAGCYFDLVVGLAMNPRELWVDDYGAEDGVTRAVDEFSERVELPFEQVPTTNGLAVFKVRRDER